MEQKFTKAFRKTLMEGGIQHKVIAANLDMTECQFSKKIKKPFSSFTESEIRIIRYSTEARINTLMELPDERAAWIFATEDTLMLSFKAVNERLAQMERSISQILLALDDSKK